MIVLQNISKYYYTDTSVTQALRKINLEFQMGEFVAITGESGSGKSTLLNVISGMDTFDEGEMYYDGEPTFQYDTEDWEDFRRNRIGFVFQNYNLIGHYSALENITSALLIMGTDEEKAKEQAYCYLEKVGLKGMEGQRASELSSGQKQRLSIARALAKNTAIIVADEPTGNLDSETGEQIIRLLKELSKDRLILMVTHNYEQAEPYVTRKVRLHDGEIVADVKVNEGTEWSTKEKTEGTERTEGIHKSTEKITVDGLTEQGKETKEEGKEAVKKGSKAWKQHQNRIARTFAQMNTRTQIGRSVLFRSFFFLIAMVSFIFIGQLYKNADDTSTKDYDDTIYFQRNDSRLSVRRKDDKELTSKDIKNMQAVRNVVAVDQYDYVNDINYYCEEGKDYHFDYGIDSENGMYMASSYFYDEENEGVKSELHSEGTPAFDKKNKFMKSITCIDESDLAKGRMPESRNEIVLYSSDENQLNKKKEIYFTAENIMGGEKYYHNTFQVVGLLKEKTSQIYFHGDFCHMISASADGDQLMLEYYYVKEKGKYMGNDQFYLVINDELEKEEEETEQTCALVSRNYIVPTMGVDNYGLVVEDAVPGNDEIYLKVNTDRKGTSEELTELDNVRSVIQVSSEKFNDQSGLFLEVSQETFDKYFPRKSTQASVYIKNYTKTDRIIRKLEKMGYSAVSTYRISSVNYNEEKVMERLVFILISLGILVVMVVVEILILRSLMKIKIKDFFVLKSMGMQLEVIHKISFYEMTRYCIEAMAVTVIVMTGLNLAGVSFINSMMIYYGILAFVTFILYNMFLECITVWAFNRLLKGRMAE